MSISGALSNALTGLTASSRAAGVVSTNLANILTEGYAPRSIELTAQGEGQGGGVTVSGVNRQVDVALLNERRLADSAVSHAAELASFATTLETEIGTPDDVQSLTARIANLEASLLSAATRPEEETRLTDVALKAGQLADKLNSVSDHLQTERTRADGQIEQTVADVNLKLEQIQSLNAQIANARNVGHPNASLQDQRQTAIDALAGLIPVRLTERDNGTVAVYTPGGAILVDGKAAVLTFQASNVIAPHMTLENGLLSGLEINGVPVITSGERSPIEGGRLAALFEVRDTLSTDAQAQVDALARNLIERFQDPSLDTTLAVGDPGVFTDRGLAFDAINEVGVAGRISLNSLIDPANGGDAYKLRDGLGTAVPGPVGNSVLLTGMQAALNILDSVVSGSLGATERSLSGHAATLTSRFSQQRLSLEEIVTFSTARQSGLVETELENGVDSDAELQRLLLIEQAYSANARMVQTVEEMLDTLMRI